MPHTLSALRGWFGRALAPQPSAGDDSPQRSAGDDSPQRSAGRGSDGTPVSNWASVGPWSEPAIAAVLPGLAVLFGVTLSGRGNDLLPSPMRMAVVLLVPIVVLLVAWTGRRWIAPVFIVIAGFELRWVDFWRGGSDVLPAVNEAIKTFLAGGNPYNHYYISTSPHSTIMPYPPVQLLLHLPGYLLDGYDGVHLTELAGAVVVLIALAWLAIRVAPTVGIVGLALYAGLPNLINVVGDGSNDTSLGAVVLVAILVVAWAARRSMSGRSAVIAGVAIGAMLATKQSTLMFGIALSAYVLFAQRQALLRYLAGLVGLLFVVSIPFLLMGPATYLHALATIGAHDIQVYGWNFWVLVQGVGWKVPNGFTVSLGNALVTIEVLLIVVILSARGVAAAAFAGLLATLAALLSADWTSYSYYAMILAPMAAIPALMVWDAGRRPEPNGADAVPDAGPASVSP